MVRSRLTDSALSAALRKGTDGAALRKDAVWRYLSGKTAKLKEERNMDTMRHKRNRLLAATGVLTAAALAAVYFSFTPGGTALAGKLIQFFAPEKQIVTQIEGGEETQTATLAQNTEGEIGYIIYIDTERYKKESAGGVDYIKALNAPEGYPPVQMEIEQWKDTDAQVAYQKLLGEAEKEYSHAEGSGQVDKPVKGWRIVAWDEKGGSEAPYEEIYTVDNTLSGCFVIRNKMFREASEGHGARFNAMLGTFKVVKSDSVVSSSPAPDSTPAPSIQPRALTWDDMAFGDAKLGSKEQDAIDECLKFVCMAGATEAPLSDETASDVGGTTRTLQWGDGTTAVIRNGKLYSLESANPLAVMPNGLHAGLKLTDFTSMLGQPREAVGALAWGVGSNDNLFVTVEDGIVNSVKISLIE